MIGDPVSQLAAADGVARFTVYGCERRELAGVVVSGGANEHYDTVNRGHRFMQCCREGLTLACVSAGAYVNLHQHLLIVVIGEELNAMSSNWDNAIVTQRPNGANTFVDQGRTDRTLLNSEKLVRSVAVITELELRRRLNVHPRTVAVVPRLGSVDLNLAL